MFDNIFGIHEQALLLHGQRMNVLTTNLANADTPNYKARDIDFASVLGSSSESAAPLPLSVTAAAHIVPLETWIARRRIEIPQSLSGIPRRQYGRNAGGAGGVRGKQRALSGESSVHQ